MEQGMTWTRRECGTGKTCAGVGQHPALPGMTIVQGYWITDPEVLADLGAAPDGEGFMAVPSELLES